MPSALRQSLEVPFDVSLVGIVAKLRPVKDLEDFFAAAANAGRDFPDERFRPESMVHGHQRLYGRLAGQFLS